MKFFDILQLVGFKKSGGYIFGKLLVQKRTERKVYASVVDLILTDTVWVLFLSGLASVFLRHTLFSRQNVNRVQIPRICILFYFKLWRAFKISHSIGWGNIIFWAQKVQFHHKLFQKKEIWPNDGADKGKMTMTEGRLIWIKFNFIATKNYHILSKK